MNQLRKWTPYFNIWTLLSVIIVLLVIAPNISIFISFFVESSENWAHVKEHILPELLKNTTLLIIFTSIGTILIGTSLAWLISAYQFPGKNFFKWALILPLAIPPYIAAYTYNGILNYTGVIQTTLRNRFDITVDQVYFDIMTLPGATFIFIFFLFPYVYTVTRAYLANQSAALVENARLFGRSNLAIFFQIILPISRAAIVGGTSLVILEVLNDYGVVQYFGVPTFSTAIFQTWFGMGDLAAAIKLAATLMIIIFMILFLESFLRRRKNFSYTTTKIRPLKPLRLTKWRAWTAFSYCMIVFSLGFLIPFIQLVDWMLLTYDKIADPVFLSLIKNSLFVAVIGSLMIVVFSIVVANFARIHRSIISNAFARVTILGYSIPGAVIAVGILTVFLEIDALLGEIYNFIGIDSVLFLSTSLFMLISAYVIRFLAVSYNSIEAGFEKIGTKYNEASRMLGMNITKSFWKVDFPMMKVPILSGFILAFVDILKELPLTLILRPFNFDTLSTKAFQYATDEQIHEAALASILIIVITAIAILIFHLVLESDERRS
ncbi:ABC transporter permease [Saliterribacillus persicus]|uniref:Iron(III) transport system permease protein n=1 Tax=Saliterribacillus persicus TaxID=930114 RepID=A0A368YD55_9BACI|nr:iron ABC transporter permease [Saliterribacillus persicus]RCW77266.1 iron(III) transport system permease protein [Saliterribacillus persicus]